MPGFSSRHFLHAIFNVVRAQVIEIDDGLFDFHVTAFDQADAGIGFVGFGFYTLSFAGGECILSWAYFKSLC